MKSWWGKKKLEDGFSLMLGIKAARRPGIAIRQMVQYKIKCIWTCHIGVTQFKSMGLKYSTKRVKGSWRVSAAGRSLWRACAGELLSTVRCTSYIYGLGSPQAADYWDQVTVAQYMQFSHIFPWVFAAGQCQRWDRAIVFCDFTQCSGCDCTRQWKCTAAQIAFHPNRQSKNSIVKQVLREAS